MSTGTIGQRCATEIAVDTCISVSALVPLDLFDWRENLTAVAEADADLCIALNRLDESDGGFGFIALHDNATEAARTLIDEWSRAAKVWNNRGRPTCQ